MSALLPHRRLLPACLLALGACGAPAAGPAAPTGHGPQQQAAALPPDGPVSIGLAPPPTDGESVTAPPPSAPPPAEVGDSASVSAPTAAAYGAAQARADLTAVLAARAGGVSGRPLGNPANVALWDDAHVASLVRGIDVAGQLYPMFAALDLGRLVVAEAAQESTGDYRLQGWSVGLLQVTPSSVVQDYNAHGTALSSRDGTVVVQPGGAIDLTDPGVSVALWAWYTHNAVASGESANEVAAGLHHGGVTRDFGNAQYCWLAGPNHDRHRDLGNYRDYHDRIEDYFVQAGFGDAAAFEALLATPLSNVVQAFRDPPASGLVF